MKHQISILLFALFFTITSANRVNDTIPLTLIKPISNQIFAPPIKTNNMVIKSVSEGKRINSKFDETYENLPAELKPKN